MTRYTVVWHSLTENELAELWMEASDKVGVNAAVQRIDAALATDANSKGTAVSTRSRELTVAPLQVLFRVSEEDRLVEIFSVASY